MFGTQDQKFRFTGPLELEGEVVELEPPQAVITITVIRAKHTLIALARGVRGRVKYCIVSKTPWETCHTFDKRSVSYDYRLSRAVSSRYHPFQRELGVRAPHLPIPHIIVPASPEDRILARRSRLPGPPNYPR